jgi:hypothetical protein
MITCSRAYHKQHDDQLRQRHDVNVLFIGHRTITGPQDLFQNPRRPLQAPLREDPPLGSPSLRPWQDRHSGT